MLVKKETRQISVIQTEPFMIKVPSFVIPVHYLKLTGIFVSAILLFVINTRSSSAVITTYAPQERGILEMCNIEPTNPPFHLITQDTTTEEEFKEKRDKSLEIRAEAIKMLRDWNPDTRTFYRKGKGNKFNKQSIKVVVSKKEMMEYMPDFIVEEVLSNVPALASITAAQTDIESNWFQSNLAVKSNNGYGIKYVKKWDRDPEVWMAQYREGHVIAHDDLPTDKFIKFKSKWACIRFHTKFLTLLHYKKHIGKNFNGWATGLRTSGYATDKNYPTTLKSKYQVLDLETIDEISEQLRKKYND